MVELASRSVAQIAHDNIIFKLLWLWRNEGRISRRLPATVVGLPPGLDTVFS